MGKKQLFHFTKVEAYFFLTTGPTTIAGPSIENFIFKILNASRHTYAACMAFELFSFKMTLFFNELKVYLL